MDAVRRLVCWRGPGVSAGRSDDVGAVHRRESHRTRYPTAPGHDHQRPAPGGGASRPGSARMLNHARAARLARLASTVAEIIDRLPTAGWTAGLFGRRDGLVLLLAASGLSFEQISALRRGGLRVDGEALVVEGTHPIRLDPSTHPGALSPAQV